MSADLPHTLELASASYKASLATVERDTVRSLDRMADRGRSSFAKLEDAHKSISRPFAVLTGAAGKLTFAVGTATALVAVIDKLANAEQRVREELQKQTREREKALAMARADNDRAARALGFGSAAETAADARKRIDQEYQGRIESLEQQISDSRQTVADLRQRKGTGDAIKAEEARQAALEAERVRALDLREREKAQATAAAFAPQLEQQDRLLAKSRSLQVEALRAQGRETEALLLAERNRFDAERDAIATLAGDNSAARDALEQQARSNHHAAMARIAEEAAARDHALNEERAERERLAALSGRWAGMDADAVEARLRGQDKESQKIQARIDHERMLESIRERAGISEDERAARLAQADRIHAMRVMDIDRSGGPRNIGGRTIEAGVIRSSQMLGQVFGGTGAREAQPAREETARKQLDIAQQQLRQLQDMARNQGIARFA